MERQIDIDIYMCVYIYRHIHTCTHKDNLLIYVNMYIYIQLQVKYPRQQILREEYSVILNLNGNLKFTVLNLYLRYIYIYLTHMVGKGEGGCMGSREGKDCEEREKRERTTCILWEETQASWIKLTKSYYSQLGPVPSCPQDYVNE